MHLHTSHTVSSLPGLIDALRQIAVRRLPGMMSAVLDQADDALFDFAQRSASSVEQQPYFDALRGLRRERGHVEQRFAARLQERFGPLSVDHGPADRAPLELVDIDLLEEQLACEQVSVACDKRHREVLHRIGSRLRRADPDVEIGEPGPHWSAQIASAFRHALAVVDTPIKARLVLYKLLERQLVPHYGELLQAFERHLQSAGLDPHRPPPARDRRPPASPDSEIAPPPHRTAGASDHFDDPRSHHGEPSASVSPNSVRPGAYRGRALDVEDEVYAALTVALASRLAMERGPQREPAAELPRQAALDALALLQTETPPSLLAAADDPDLTMADLLAGELIAGARSLGLASGHAHLQPQDAQALALVGMLFDVLLAQRSYHRDVRQQFVRLSVPYARAAMLDPHLFALKTHPARRLLDALADASDGNRGETAPERDLLSRMHQVVERLVVEFNEDITIFSELERDFRTFLDQHARRVRLSEQRAAEAQNGRERLDAARARAARALAALTGERKLPDNTAGRFLRDAWVHHLSMLDVRGDADSERYRRAQRTGAAVWGLLLGGGHAADIDALRPQLSEVLASSGVHDGAADACIDELRACVGAADSDPRAASAPIIFRPPTATGAAPHATDGPSASSADCRLARPRRNGDDAAADTIGSGTHADSAHIERIHALEIGAWVEFVADDGSTVPAKLSWISPISSRRLFVNRRGLRHCAVSVDELVAMLADGTLVLRGDDSAFTRAMLQVLGHLRETDAARPSH